MVRFVTVMLICLLFVEAKGQENPLSREMKDSVKRVLSPVSPVKIRHGRIESPSGFETEKMSVAVATKDSLAKIKKRKDPDNSSWRLGINAGWELCIAPIPYDLPKDLEKYKSGLRYGHFIGADAVHFFNRNIGAGFKYSMFKTGNKSELSYTLNNGTSFNGYMSDNIFVHYIGPYLSLRSIPKRNKVYANCDFSIGYTLYYNNSTLGAKDYVLSGDNFGFMSSLGADFMVSRGMSLGLNLSIIAASIRRSQSEEHDLALNGEQSENWSRISLGLIIRYYK